MSLAPQTRSLATLHRIVESTRRLLSRRDYASLSMRAVATRAGLSPGAIYRHFSSKRHLVDYVCRATLEEFQVELAEVIARHPPGSFERVVAQGEAYIRLALEKPEHFKVVFGQVKPDRTRLRDLPGEGGYRLLRKCVLEAMESGRIRKSDPDLATFFLWSRVHGIVTLLMACDFGDALPLRKQDITPLRLFELSRTLLWEGLKPPSRRAARAAARSRA